MSAALLCALLLAAAPSRSILLVPFVPQLEPGVELSAVDRLFAGAMRTRLGVSIVSEERVFGATDAELKSCGADRACIAGVLDRTGIDLAMLVVIDLRLTPALASIELVSKSGGEPLARVAGEVAREELAVKLGELIDRALDRAGVERGAELTIAVDPPAANVSIAGAPITGARVVLPAGRHFVRAEHPGRPAREEVVELAPGERRVVKLMLAAPAEAPPALHERWWFWTALGVVLAGAAVSAVVIAGDDPATCVCANDRGLACPPGC